MYPSAAFFCNHPWKATLRSKLCEILIFLLFCKSLVFKNKKLLHSSVATLSIFMIFRSSVSLSVFLDNRSCKVFSYLPWVKEYPNREKTILEILIFWPWENRPISIYLSSLSLSYTSKGHCSRSDTVNLHWCSAL